MIHDQKKDSIEFRVTTSKKVSSSEGDAPLLIQATFQTDPNGAVWTKDNKSNLYPFVEGMAKILDGFSLKQLVRTIGKIRWDRHDAQSVVTSCFVTSGYAVTFKDFNIIQDASVDWYTWDWHFYKVEN